VPNTKDLINHVGGISLKLKNIYRMGLTIGMLACTLNVYADKGIVTGDRLNVRSAPGTQNQIVLKLYNGDNVNIVEKVNDWYAIELGRIDSNIAYVHSDYIKKIEEGSDDADKALVGRVNVDVLNVRSGNSTNYAKIAKVYRGQQLEIVSVGDQWIKVVTTGKTTGYVYKRYVTLNQISPADPSYDTTLGEQVVAYGKQFIGNPYVYGGNSLTNGVDCSGFTQQVFKHFGININRSSYTQYNNGVRTSKSELKPGDLVFYGYNGRISHVGIYIGNKKIVHANDYKTGILIGNLDPTNGKPYIGATRVIN